VTIHELFIGTMWKKAVVCYVDTEENYEESLRQPDEFGNGISRVRYMSGGYTADFMLLTYILVLSSHQPIS
jgi:hypothetical protein